ncbi:hypothetical protein EDM53_00675 [Rickettsiales endosymbiont of Peranema trichophorum]|uniref:C40 family peptidase n=1 Tax=Rickettsiales endosymbiont of Peranema trichophorum TaxID=2486577 RepID=UPI00102388A6|nr:SH3 domain-containing C40 family peptidase [Rickettsiales endosymbiont of Peranema trichophorum]RZI47670.1 hypothetical protein EDM53_00675 [Rickettsiales endosymbiont of Peranema trichophorum]
MFRRTLVQSLLLLVLVSGCTNTNYKSASQKNTCIPIQDLASIPQDPAYVAEFAPSAPELIKGGDVRSYNSFILSPWEKSASTVTPDTQRAFEYPLSDCYRENLCKYTNPDFAESLKLNANFGAINTAKARGIVVSHANLRKMPTDFPCFYDSQSGGQGYPFDNLQNSLIYAGTPVFISHFSKDKAWALVESPYSEAGFVKVSEIAIVDQQAFDRVSNLDIAVISSDQVPLYSGTRQFWSYSRVGMVLFVEKDMNTYYKALLPVRAENGFVSWHSINLSKQISSTDAMGFTSENLKKLINVLLSQHYGWGGYMVNRDCSSLVRDYFSVFRIPLPRNSFGQSKEGKVVDLANMSLKAKRQAIIKHGVPFRTILYRPGHIGIYLGYKDGKILMLQSVWGNHIRRAHGRNIIGRTVISSVEYGQELKEVDKESLFLNLVSSMSVL